jgi:hypothetical protein
VTEANELSAEALSTAPARFWSNTAIADSTVLLERPANVVASDESLMVMESVVLEPWTNFLAARNTATTLNSCYL